MTSPRVIALTLVALVSSTGIAACAGSRAEADCSAIRSAWSGASADLDGWRSQEFVRSGNRKAIYVGYIEQTVFFKQAQQRFAETWPNVDSADLRDVLRDASSAEITTLWKNTFTGQMEPSDLPDGPLSNTKFKADVYALKGACDLDMSVVPSQVPMPDHLGS